MAGCLVLDAIRGGETTELHFSHKLALVVQQIIGQQIVFLRHRMLRRYHHRPVLIWYAGRRRTRGWWGTSKRRAGGKD